MEGCVRLSALGDRRPTTSSRLSKTITVIRLVAEANGNLHDGGISELPAGAEVEICGEGFNERTVIVHWRGEFFFVFLQDLERPAD